MLKIKIVACGFGTDWIPNAACLQGGVDEVTMVT